MFSRVSYTTKAEERIVAKIRQIKGVKSVKSLLKVEEKK